jgi:23S rRNA (uracil1939-C5)-methyltransferase
MRNKRKNIIYEDIKITDTANKGKSLGKTVDGKIIFIEKGVPGDVVNVSVFKKRKGFLEGKIEKLISPSPNRIDPECEYFGLCGGCKWQNMDYSSQLIFKQKEVYENIKRIGEIDLINPENILGSSKKYFYRNKMEFSFSNRRWLTMDEINDKENTINKNGLGFHKPGMWDKVIDIKKCYLQTDPSNEIRNSVRRYSFKKNLSFYDYYNKSGLLRTLMIRTSSNGDVMVLIQFFENDLKNITGLLNHLISKFPSISSLNYCVNTKENDTIYDQKIICFSGKSYITESMENLRFKITPKSFYQTNSKQAYELYKIALDYSNIKISDIVYDLYTGTGTIAQFISKKCKKVIGIESVSEAIEAAKFNTKVNKIKNAEFILGDMKVVFNDEFIKKYGKADIIITDPPRDGMHKKVIEQILKLSPKKIVYISCNSATQARDLFLLKSNYKVSRSRAVDMFPQTHHIENVVLLDRK